MLTIAAIADLHGFLPSTPECDVLIVAGDVCPVVDHSLSRQREWLEGPFSEWLRAQPASEIVGIAGNHDWIFQEDREIGYTLPWTYLENESVEIGGLLFWGSPLSGEFRQWAFMMTENALAEIWATIPDLVDVLITHGPAYGACDLTEGMVYAGSPSLREQIVQTRPSLQVTGHIHEAYGTDRVGKTVVGNASIINARYELVNKPLLFRMSEGYTQQLIY